MKSKKSRSRWWQSVEGDRYFAAGILAIVLISVGVPTVSGLVLTATAEYTTGVILLAVGAVMAAFVVAIGLKDALDNLEEQYKHLENELDDMTGQFCNEAIHLTRAEDRVRELEEQLEALRKLEDALASSQDDQDEVSS